MIQWKFFYFACYFLIPFSCQAKLNNGVYTTKRTPSSFLKYTLKRVTVETFLKTIFFSFDDIARNSAKYIVYSLIRQKKLLRIGSMSLKTHQLVDYGIEALWTVLFESITKVPHRLIQYLLVEQCYTQLDTTAQYYHFHYPFIIKDNPYAYGCANILVPIFVKRTLSLIFDTLVDAFVEIEEEGDSALNQSLIIS